jgi:hypothetical protein
MFQDINICQDLYHVTLKSTNSTGNRLGLNVRGHHVEIRVLLGALVKHIKHRQTKSLGLSVPSDLVAKSRI